MNTLKSTLPTIKKAKWKSIWAGDWSLLGCSDWGEFYTRAMKVKGERFLNQVVFLYKSGRVSTWVEEKDIERFSKHLAKVIGSNIVSIKKVCTEFQRQTDIALRFMKDYQGIVAREVYKNYLKIIRNYYRLHIQVKYLSDALPEQLLKKYLPYLEKARLYAEPVFTTVISFDIHFAKSLGKKVNVDPRLILVATKDEIADYFRYDIFPKVSVLKKRWLTSALIISRRSFNLFTGQDAKRIEKALLPQSHGLINGQPAYKGKATGKVRVVWDPDNSKDFKKGDILVTNMTRVEFLPIMKKSAAIITDAGGVLCHAAITARELKIPCIIDTKIATRVLRDGDLVEVDADKGVVRKIK